MRISHASIVSKVSHYLILNSGLRNALITDAIFIKKALPGELIYF